MVEEVYSEVDKFLNGLAEGKSLIAGALPQNTRGSVAFLLEKYDLIRFRNPQNKHAGIVDITINGLEVVKVGGLKNYIDKIEREESEHKELEKKNLLLNIDMMEKVLKEYPTTKWMARAGFIISAALLLLELIKLATGKG